MFGDRIRSISLVVAESLKRHGTNASDMQVTDEPSVRNIEEPVEPEIDVEAIQDEIDALESESSHLKRILRRAARPRPEGVKPYTHLDGQAVLLDEESGRDQVRGRIDANFDRVEELRASLPALEQ